MKNTKSGSSCHKLFSALFGLALIAATSSVNANEQANATLMDTNGESVGSVNLTQTPHGTLLHVKLENMPAGAHAFHIHTTGACEPSFKAAGGHYNPGGHKHGITVAEGMHAGDMPNIHVPDTGMLELEILNTQVNLDDSLFDEDGAAIVIHEGPDDYASDPAGAAGARIACGVISK